MSIPLTFAKFLKTAKPLAQSLYTKMTTGPKGGQFVNKGTALSTNRIDARNELRELIDNVVNVGTKENVILNDRKVATLLGLPFKSGTSLGNTLGSQSRKGQYISFPSLPNNKTVIRKTFDNMIDLDKPAIAYKNIIKDIAKKHNVSFSNVQNSLRGRTFKKDGVIIPYRTMEPYENFTKYQAALRYIAQPSATKSLKRTKATLGDIVELKNKGETIPSRKNFSSIESRIENMFKDHVAQGGNKVEVLSDGSYLYGVGKNRKIYNNKSFESLDIKKDPNFKEVYEMYRQAKKANAQKFIHPVTGKPAPYKEIMQDAGLKGIDVDHAKTLSVEPFTNLRLMDGRLNTAAGTITKFQKNPDAVTDLLKKDMYVEHGDDMLKKMGYDFSKDINKIQSDGIAMAAKVLKYGKQYRTPGQISKESVGVTNRLEIGKEMSKPNKAGKSYPIGMMKDGGKVESIDDIIREHFEIGGIVGKSSNFGSVGGSGFKIGNIGQDNEIGTIQSMLAGIGAGIIDIPKGAFSLGASLVDLGLGTNHAAKVEKFFDNLTTLDEKAEATTAGNLTRIITNLGIPGTQAFKIGSRLTKQALVAKKKGQYFKLSDKKMEARMQDALNVNGRLLTTAGGAAGIGVSDAIFVGDPEQVGTIGDMFGGGPTALTPNDENSAGREVMNRMKFGLESSLFAGIIGATGSAIKTAMKRSDDLDGNNKTIEYVLSKLRPRGAKPQEFFDLERGQIGIRQADVNRAQEIQRGVDKHIDALFPQLKNTFNKTTQKTRSKLLEELNETLLSGKADIDGLTGKFKFGEMDPKLVARDTARLKELGAKNPKAIFDSFYDIRVEWDEMFTALGTRMDPKLRKEFGDSFGKKMADYLGSTYQIFQNTGSKLISNFKPGQEALDKAATLFKQADAESKGFKTIKEAETAGKALSDEQADYYVNNIIKTATPPRGLSTSAEKTSGIMFRAPDFFLNKTVMDDLEFKGIIKLSDVDDEAKKVIENLLGKINDPTQTILGGTARLSMLTRRNQFFDNLVKSSDEAIADGKKGFFYNEEIDAINAFGRENVKKVNMDPNKALEAGTTNPINGKFAHKGVADALEETSQNILGEGALANVYNNFILYPKAASQLAKTVLSPVTHFRNFISAGAFAAGNGIIPNVDAFQTAFKSLQVPLKGAREQNDFYRKLLRLGVVNSNVRLGDLQRLLSDVQFGASASTIPGLRRLAKQGAKLKKGAEEFYTAEDDFWKITSFAMERQRYDQAYKKAGILKSADELDEIAADIVRNNIPNYDYVNDFVKGLRKFPIGNFVSFPAEIMRTSGNILHRAFKEINFKQTLADGRVIKPLSGIGYKRLMGFGATAVVIPTGVVEGAKAIYDVSGAEMDALRRFVPDWSKNSTLIPIRDEDGSLKYIDFSHANAYDTMIRPFMTMKNAIQDGAEDEAPVMQSVFKGLYEGIGETISPFVSEAIWTQAATDIFLRGGRTKTGQRLYTDQTPFGEKASIIASHLVETQLPGSIGTFERLGLAVTSKPDEYGREYELTDEALGFMGMRAVKVDPITSMKFKIADYTTGVNNSRREFTRPLLKGGPVTPEQIVDRYMVANEQLFKVQQDMNKDYYAARVLGSGQGALDREFKDRVSGKALNAIKRGQFKPFIPSDNIIKSFSENARALGQTSPYNSAKAVIDRLARQYSRTNMMVEPFPFNNNPFTAENTSLPTAGMGDTNVSLPNLGLNMGGSNLSGINRNTLAKGQQVFGATDSIFGR